jgi:hypothetical protein
MLAVGAGRQAASVELGRCWPERLLYFPAVPVSAVLTPKCQPRVLVRLSPQSSSSRGCRQERACHHPNSAESL